MAEKKLEIVGTDGKAMNSKSEDYLLEVIEKLKGTKTIDVVAAKDDLIFKEISWVNAKRLSYLKFDGIIKHNKHESEIRNGFDGALDREKIFKDGKRELLAFGNKCEEFIGFDLEVGADYHFKDARNAFQLSIKDNYRSLYNLATLLGAPYATPAMIEGVIREFGESIEVWEYIVVKAHQIICKK
jgi:hypothetical protein